MTIQRAWVWASPEPLWRDTISHAPELQAPRTKLADILVEEGRLDEAESVYQSAISITPNPAWELYGAGYAVFARRGLAKIYERQGRFSEAAPLLDDALLYRASPELMAVACVHGGYVAMRQRNPTRELQYYRRAAEWDPRNRDAQRALARLSSGEKTRSIP